MEKNTCCFIGHRTMDETYELTYRLSALIEKLIVDKKVDTFLFGSKSRFNDLCHKLVTKSKIKYPQIKRIYVRAEFPFISDSYKAYLLKDYEETYYPEKMIGSGKASYVERNFEMIRNSNYCVFYYNESNKPVTRKSGTEIALKYAVKENNHIIIIK